MFSDGHFVAAKAVRVSKNVAFMKLLCKKSALHVIRGTRRTQKVQPTEDRCQEMKMRATLWPRLPTHLRLEGINKILSNIGGDFLILSTSPYSTNSSPPWRWRPCFSAQLPACPLCLKR